MSEGDNVSSWVIRHMAVTEGDTSTFIAKIDEFLATLRRPPALIQWTSSAETACFFHPDVTSLVQALTARLPEVPQKIVSQACLGLHASLLDAIGRDIDSTLIIFVEKPLPILQQVIDVTANSHEGLRLIAQEGLGFIHLENTPSDCVKPDDLVISQVEIHCQEPGLLGPLKLTKAVIQSIKQHIPSSALLPVVSFDLHSQWAKELLKYFEQIGEKALHPHHWLGSCEPDERHYLTLKPLKEISAYSHHAADNHLVIFSLGAGGRMGLLTINSGLSTNTQKPDHISRYPFHYECESAIWHTDRKIDADLIRSSIRYINPRFRGPRNLFFEWSMK